MKNPHSALVTEWGEMLTEHARQVVFQDFFNVTVHRHLMGCRIDENLLVKLWRKPNVEAAFKSNPWFFVFGFAYFQIVIHGTVEIDAIIFRKLYAANIAFVLDSIIHMRHF